MKISQDVSKDNSDIKDLLKVALSFEKECDYFGSLLYAPIQSVIYFYFSSLHTRCTEEERTADGFRTIIECKLAVIKQVTTIYIKHFSLVCAG